MLKLILSFFILVCHKEGIQPVAIFGPQDAIADGAVRDQCALVEIPHIQAAWLPYDPDMQRIIQSEEKVIEKTSPDEEPNTGEDQPTKDVTAVEEEAPITFKKITVNFFPDSDEISTAYANLLKYYQWESFAVLYEDEFGKYYLFKMRH